LAALHARPTITAVGLEGLVVLQRAAAADPDVEPAAAHHVQHGQLLGQVHRVMQRQQAHAHAEAQGGRAGRDERCEDWRGGAEAVVVEMVLGDPDGLVTERLGCQHLLEAGVVDSLLAPPLVPLHEEEQPEFHRTKKRVQPRETNPDERS
jgi:hypothetical protein